MRPRQHDETEATGTRSERLHDADLPEAGKGFRVEREADHGETDEEGGERHDLHQLYAHVLDASAFLGGESFATLGGKAGG